MTSRAIAAEITSKESVDDAGVDRQRQQAAGRPREDRARSRRSLAQARRAPFSTPVSSRRDRARTPRRRSSSRPTPWLVIAARTSGASATRSTSFWASSLSRTLSQTRLAVSLLSSRSVAFAAVSLSSARSTPRSTARSRPSRRARPCAPRSPARATGAAARCTDWIEGARKPSLLLTHPSRVVSPLVASGRSHPTTEDRRGAVRSRSITEPAPDHKLPDGPMDPIDAHLLIEQELFLDGDPEKQPGDLRHHLDGAGRRALIAENLHRNFIDHAEYPQTAEIEQRCIRMLADLFHAPGETTGARTQGSSEAIMLGALALKWKWRERREAAGKATDQAEPRLRRRRPRRLGEVLPLLRRRAADRPAAGGQVHDRAGGRRAAHRREHDRRRRRARHDFHRPRRRHRRASTTCSCSSRRRRGSTSRCTSTAPAAASSGRSSTRTPSGTSGSSRCARSTPRATSSASSIPGIGWLIFRETSDLAGRPRLLRELPRQDGRHLHAELLDRLGDGAGPVLQLHPLRPARATAT